MLTNIYPIKITSETFDISRIKYSEDLLKELRGNYNEDNSFFREGEFIYISPHTTEKLNIGENEVNLTVKDNEEVVSSLIKHIFFRKFIELHGVIPLSFYPLKFISRKHDIIENLLPKDLKDILGFKRQIEIQFRIMKINGEPTHCMLPNIVYKWTFDKNCLELHKEGFKLMGLDVLHSVEVPYIKNVLAPDGKLIGAIQKINKEESDIIAEIETNEGIVKHPLEKLFLEKNNLNLDKYLSYKLGNDKKNRIIKKIKSNKLKRFDLEEIHNEFQKLANLFAKPTYENFDKFSFTISSNSNLPNNSLRIYKPSYIFDDDDIQKHPNPYLGIDSYGPSDKSYFTPKELNILVICHSQNRGTFSNFIANLENGLPNKTDRYGNIKKNYFADGMLGKYRLHSMKFNIEEIQDFRMGSYRSQIKKYLKSEDKPNIVILEIDKNFKSLDIAENPYYQIKADLLNLGILVQSIDCGTIKELGKLESFFNNVALQMYAKLGGIPWALPNRRSYDKEIVIGVGSHLERKNKYANNENSKVVGITTFFSGEGRYLQGNKCSEVDYDNYFSELLSSLKTSIDDISQEYNWKEDSTILIIFHIFKPIKKVEAQVVEKLITEYKNYKIKYAFLTISDRHPFLLFDPHQKGVGYDENDKKGKFLPAATTNLILDEDTCLLQSRGPYDIKTKKQGLPKPLLIKLIPSENQDINFRDLSHITQQIFQFSNLSFSNFATSRFPVTIYYSGKIAMWLSRLRKTENWNPQIVNTELKNKKWFL